MRASRFDQWLFELTDTDCIFIRNFGFDATLFFSQSFPNRTPAGSNRRSSGPPSPFKKPVPRTPETRTYIGYTIDIEGQYKLSSIKRYASCITNNSMLLCNQHVIAGLAKAGRLLIKHNLVRPILSFICASRTRLPCVCARPATARGTSCNGLALQESFELQSHRNSATIANCHRAFKNHGPFYPVPARPGTNLPVTSAIIGNFRSRMPS
jgi:hypothetical protein